MAKSKGKGAKEPKKESPFWKPEKVGEVMEGKFLQFQETKIVERGKTKLSAAIVLDNGVLVPLYWSIVHSEFRDVAPTLKPGTKLKFEYMGKGGRSKTVRCFVAGKEMKISGGFDVIPAKKISSFFVK
jgi:hypothetical protein